MPAKQNKTVADWLGLFLLAAAALALAPATVRAEVSQVRIARQYGIAWMPFVLMERNKLIEKQAEKAGLGSVAVEWRTFAGGNVMNDALLSGGLDYATTGIPGFLTLWDKAKTVLPIKAVSGFGSVPFALITRNPDVKTLADFTDKDRIALPTVKISGQAVLLQMAAEKAFGVGQHAKLDPLTISRANPDGMASLVSGTGEITSQFASPPYQNIALKTPGVHIVLTTKEIFDKPFSNGLFYTTGKFHDANPKLYKVVLDALDEAIKAINTERRTALTQYLEVTKEPMTVDTAMEVLSDPFVDYSLTPHKVQATAEFMHRTGSLKTKPADWKEMFFPEVHGLPGS